MIPGLAQRTVPLTLRRYTDFVGVREVRTDIEALLALVQSGSLKVVTQGTFALEQAGEALRLIEDREVFGKVVVAP